MIKSKKLLKFKKIQHGFFNQKGGKSKGIYDSLNCGIGSNDIKKNILKNLSIVSSKIGVPYKKLILLNQIHSSKFHFISNNYKFNKNKLKGDALVTNIKGVALGVLTADCVPILIYDKHKNIISAIHAGWKGAYKGIVNKVISFLIKNGSEPENLIGVVGPCISQKNYEVKKDFKEKFNKKDKKNKKFFKTKKNIIYFDLPNYVKTQLNLNKISNIDMNNTDTFIKKNNFFSARRALKSGHNDYGRNISIIMIN